MLPGNTLETGREVVFIWAAVGTNPTLTRQVTPMRQNCAGDDAAAATPRGAWLAR
jgi:hypothetical protein